MASDQAAPVAARFGWNRCDEELELATEVYEP